MISQRTATCRRIVSPRAFRRNFLGGIIAIVIKILGVKGAPAGIRVEMSKRGRKTDDALLWFQGMRNEESREGGERERERWLERRQAGVP